MGVLAAWGGGVLVLDDGRTSEPAAADESGVGGDRSKGRKVFRTHCRNCHSARPEKYGTFGPNLYRVVGRMAGNGPQHDYSEALLAADFEWTAARLEAYLTDPDAYLPGTEMTFPGLASAQDRADVIAYLIAAGQR